MNVPLAVKFKQNIPKIAEVASRLKKNNYSFTLPVPKVHTIVDTDISDMRTMKPNNTSDLLSFFGLSIATVPFIFSILALYLVAELVTELGKASEEIFRSERLPILNFPNL